MFIGLVWEHFSIYHIWLLTYLSIRKGLRAVISLLHWHTLAFSLSRYQEVGSEIHRRRPSFRICVVWKKVSSRE